MAAESELQVHITGEDAASAVIQHAASQVEHFDKAAAHVGASGGGEGFEHVGHAAEHAGHMAEEAEPRFEHLKETMADVGKVAAGFIVGSALQELTSGLGEQLESLVGKTTEWGEQVRVLSQNTGMSAEQASTWALAMKDQGVSIDAGTIALTRLAKGLPQVDAATGKTFGGTKQVTDALEGMGVEFETAGHKVLPMSEILENVADKFKAMPDGMEKSNAAMTLFGRSGAQLLPLLNLGKEGMEEVEAEAKKYGLQLSGDNVASIRKFALAHNEMDAAVEGAKLQLGTALMPILTHLSQELTEGVVHVREWLAAFSHTETFAQMKGALETIGTVFSKVVDIVKALAGGDANSFFLALSEGFGAVGGDAERFHTVLTNITGFLFGTLPQAFGMVKEVIAGFGDMFSGADQDGQRFAEALDTLFGPGNPVSDFIGRIAGKILDIRDAFATAADAVAPVMSHFQELAGSNIASILVGVGVAIASIVIPAFVGWAVAAGAAAVATIAAMLPVIVPLLLVTAAVAALHAAWVNNWGDIQGKTQAVVSFFQSLPGTIGGIFNAVGTAIHGAIDAVTGFVGAHRALIPVMLLVLGPVGLLIGAVVAVVAAFKNWGSITTMVGTFLTALGTMVHTTMDNFLNLFKAPFEAIGNFFKEWWPLLAVIFTAGLAIPVAQVINHWSQIQAFTMGVWNAISGFIAGVVQAIVGFLVPPIAAASQAVQQAWQQVLQVTTTVWNTIWTTITNVAAQIVTTLLTAGTRFFAVIKEAWDTISKAMASFLQPILDAIGSFIGQVMSLLGTMASEAFAAAQKVGQAILDGIKAAIQAGWEALKTFVGNFAASLLEAAKHAIGAHSPSVKFMELGQDIMAGLQLGMQAGLPDVQATMTHEIGGLPSLAAGGISGASVSPGAGNGGGINYNRLAAAIVDAMGSGNVNITMDGQQVATVVRKNLLRQGNSLTSLGF